MLNIVNLALVTGTVFVRAVSLLLYHFWPTHLTVIFFNLFSLPATPLKLHLLKWLMIFFLLWTTDFTSVFLLLNLWILDTIDHCIFLDPLENQFVSGLALVCLKSYLSETTQCISYNNNTSNFYDVKYGVPQGSVLFIFHLLTKFCAVRHSFPLLH